MADISIPLEVANGSIATIQLHETIKEFNKGAEQQTQKLIRLTWAIAVLTLVMIVAVFVQIAVALA